MQESGADGKGGVKITDTTPEFEEYTSAPRVDEQGRPIPKARGLNALGYRFPPPGGPQEPLTKANLAKGIGLQPAPSAPAAPPPVPESLVRQLDPAPIARPTPPPAVKVDEAEQFEEYRRPGLDQRPPTGKGIRTEPPPPPTAKEILQSYEPPQPEVIVPKRFSIMPASGKARPRPQEEDAAHLDALADLAAAPGAVMSHSMSNGPIKTVIHHDDDDRHEDQGQVESKPAEAAGVSVPLTPPTPAAPSIPYVPPAAPADPPVPAMPPIPTQVSAPAPPVPSTPHHEELGLEPGGDAPRIGIVRAQFHRAITQAMLEAAGAEAERLGAPVAAVLEVPGAYDIPLAAKRLLQRDDIDAVVAIGCVIQGETGHDEAITQAMAQTLLALACNADKPVGLGVTGPRMTETQAWARVQNGAFAVQSVVAQHRLLRSV